MSIRAWLVRRTIYAAFRKPVKGQPLEVRMRQFPKALAKLGTRPFKAEGRASITPAADYGGASEWVTAAGAEGRRRILYMHGGGYTWGEPPHFRDLAWRLSAATGASVLLLDYPLAPAAQAPAQGNAALAAYERLLVEAPPESIALAGDSAGGGLSLTLAQRINKAGLAQPAAISLISPWLDISGSGKSARENFHRDAMLDGEALALAGRSYAGDLPVDDPEVSPLFGELAGLAPILAQVGSTEVLRDDSVRLAERARTVGVEVELDVWRNMHHDWHMSAAVIPEGRKAIADMADFMTKHWRRAESAAQGAPVAEAAE